MDDTRNDRKPGWWYPYIFVAFFAVIISVNAVMMYLAVSTFQGVATTDSYLKGVGYNRAIQKAEAQQDRGWSGEFSFNADAVGDGGAEGALRLRIADPQGDPVKDLAVTARMVRPLERGQEFTVTLQELSPGLYGVHTALPRKGQWEVRFAAREKADGPTLYRQTERVVAR